MKTPLIMMAMVASLIATPSMAKELSARERTQLEAEAATQASITRDMQDRARSLDRAYKAAKTADVVIGAAASRVPYGSAAYKGGKAIGNTLYNTVKRRRAN